MFWLGGPSLAFKSPSQMVYVIDPVFDASGDQGPVGAIDIRPDLVICTLRPPAGIDVSTLSSLATAYPDAQFVSSAGGRDAMIGRDGTWSGDDVPVNPARVHAMNPGATLDVRTYGLRDSLKVRPLPVNPNGPWSVFYNFGSIQVCVMRGTDLGVGVLGVSAVRPRYVIPIGYDRHARGGERARRLREEVAGISGVKAYIFPDNYMEGLVYSRIMSRQRRGPKSRK